MWFDMKNIKTTEAGDFSAIMHNPVGRHLGYMLRRASSVIMAGLGSSLASIDLRPVEATILSLIATNPGCTQSDLGRMLSIQRANMVPLITGLVTRGYICKTAADGRSHALNLTEQGIAKCQEAESMMDQHETSIAQQLDRAGHDVARLEEALTAIMKLSA
ncbi:MAG: MarR family transcriptional regulator [Sphingobium sp.]|nr:MarR family transcriptional regulator [Sphingobium sp.]